MTWQYKDIKISVLIHHHLGQWMVKWQRGQLCSHPDYCWEKIRAHSKSYLIINPFVERVDPLVNYNNNNTKNNIITNILFIKFVLDIKSLFQNIYTMLHHCSFNDSPRARSWIWIEYGIIYLKSFFVLFSPSLF